MPGFDLAKRLKYGHSFFRKNFLFLNLQLLYQCNFACRICDFWKKPYRSREMLDPAKVPLIAEKLREVGPLIVSIGGGEPLMHPGIFDIASILTRDHFPVMISNGWFMDEANARKTWESGFYEVSISVDYADPKRHDKSRGKKGAYDNAIRALEHLQAQRISPYQRVNMITTIMDDNLEDVETLLQRAGELGVTYMVSSYSPLRGTVNREAAGKDFSGHLLVLKKKYSQFVSLRGYLAQFNEALNNPQGVTPCSAGKNLFNIDCEGNVTPCIDQLENRMGNILTDDMSEILKNLAAHHKTNTCGLCWTSCRGPIETLLSGRDAIRNHWDNYKVVQPLPLL